jgi:hypothetical protein
MYVLCMYVCSMYVCMFYVCMYVCMFYVIFVFDTKNCHSFMFNLTHNKTIVVLFGIPNWRESNVRGYFDLNTKDLAVWSLLWRVV